MMHKALEEARRDLRTRLIPALTAQIGSKLVERLTARIRDKLPGKPDLKVLFTGSAVIAGAQLTVGDRRPQHTLDEIAIYQEAFLETFMEVKTPADLIRGA